MPQFSVNPHRHQPYKSNRFEIEWQGSKVPGVIRLSGLRRVTRVVEHRDGDDPYLSLPGPGSTDYQPIVMERVVTHDHSFEEWADKVASRDTPGVSLADYRRDILISLLNEAGQRVIVYKLFDCWPSEYEALSALDASADGVALERLVLQCAGWQRDDAVQEPVEPSFEPGT